VKTKKLFGKTFVKITYRNGKTITPLDNLITGDMSINKGAEICNVLRKKEHNNRPVKYMAGPELEEGKDANNNGC